MQPSHRLGEMILLDYERRLVEIILVVDIVGFSVYNLFCRPEWNRGTTWKKTFRVYNASLSGGGSHNLNVSSGLDHEDNYALRHC